jgi:hypothetical protein
MSDETKRYVVVTTKDDGRAKSTIVVNGDATLEQAFEAARKCSLYMTVPSSIVIHVDASQQTPWWEDLGTSSDRSVEEQEEIEPKADA